MGLANHILWLNFGTRDDRDADMYDKKYQISFPP
jgi:hypothetical protein